MISTVTSSGATRPMALYTSCMAADAADDAVGLSAASASSSKTAGTWRKPAQLQGPLHHLAQLVEVDRLEQILEGAALHGLDGRLGGGVGGDDDDRQARIDLADAVEDLQARHVRQAHVEDDRVGPLPLDQLDALRPVGAASHFQGVGLEAFLHRIEHVGLVIDHEQVVGMVTPRHRLRLSVSLSRKRLSPAANGA